jgi:signal transduction histidine kinase
VAGGALPRCRRRSRLRAPHVCLDAAAGRCIPRSAGHAPAVWPPADIGQLKLRIQALAPGDAAPLFDSDKPGATLPFSLSELGQLLLPGERLHVRRSGAPADLLMLTGSGASTEPIAPWLAQLIDRLPVDPVPLQVRETLSTPQGRYDLLLEGDMRSVNQGLAAVATRLSGFVGAMLLAVLLTWLAIEVRIIRRVTLLTKRAAAVSTGMRAGGELASLDLSDLRGRDELGVLSQGLKDLLQRVNEDVRREQIRAAQEKDMWHAVGHEIMSPLQSLMVLHGDPGDPSARYISRMQQAVRVLYGQASPSEAFESTTLALAPLDLDSFLGHVADNARYIGIDAVEYRPLGKPVMVRADEYSLEDVLGHVLRNADRHRHPGTPVRMALKTSGLEVQVALHNQGEPIADDMLPRIFEYGVSGSEHAAGRGQGLFVARTYMAKMGGTIAAANGDDGVTITLALPMVPTAS